jgi:hypothetical protein
LIYCIQFIDELAKILNDFCVSVLLHNTLNGIVGLVPTGFHIVGYSVSNCSNIISDEVPISLDNLGDLLGDGCKCFDANLFTALIENKFSSAGKKILASRSRLTNARGSNQQASIKCALLNQL